MTNMDWMKWTWIHKIENMTEDEMYDLLTNGTIRGGICQYCEQMFLSCEENLPDDDTCKERFINLCGMEYKE